MMKHIINLLLVLFVYNSCAHHGHHHHTWNHHHRLPDNTWNHQYRAPDNTWNHRQRTPVNEYPTIVRFQNMTHRSYFVITPSPTGYLLQDLPPDFSPSTSGSYTKFGLSPGYLSTIRSKNEYWRRNRVSTYQSNPQSQVPQQSYLPISDPNTVSQQIPFHNYVNTAKQQNQYQPRYADPIHSQQNSPPISPNTVPMQIAPHNSTEIRQDLLRQYLETTIPWQNRPRTYPNTNIPEKNPESTYSVPTAPEKNPRSAFSDKSVPQYNTPTNYPNVVPQLNPRVTPRDSSIPQYSPSSTYPNGVLQQNPHGTSPDTSVPQYNPPPIHPNPHHTYSVTTAPPLAPRHANKSTFIPQQNLPRTYQGSTVHQQTSPPPQSYPGSNGALQQNSNHTYSVQNPPRADAGTTLLRQNQTLTYQEPDVLQQTYKGTFILQQNPPRNYQGSTVHQQTSPPPRPYPGSNGAPQQNPNHTYSVQNPPRADAGTTLLRQNPSLTYQEPAVLQTSSPIRPYQGSAVLQKNISYASPESNGARQNWLNPTQTVASKRTTTEKSNPSMLDPILTFVEELFCDVFFIEREQQPYCNNGTKQIFDGPGYILYIPIKVSRKESIEVKIKHRVLSVVAPSAGGKPQNQLLVLPSFVNTRNVGWQFNKGIQIFFAVKNQGSCEGSFDDTVRAVPRIARDRFTLNDVNLPFL